MKRGLVALSAARALASSRHQLKPEYRYRSHWSEGDVLMSPAEFAAFLKKDHERWGRVIKASGVKAQ